MASTYGQRTRAVGCALLLLMCGACGQDSPRQSASGGRTSPRPDLLLITVDTVRADALGCYGRADAHTPASDRLAAQGTVFEQAYTPYPLTLPAHTSMMTGLLPFQHGVQNNAIYTPADSVLTLAQRLSASGYSTAAVVSAFVLDARFRLDRGFAHYDCDLPAPADSIRAPDAGEPERSAASTTDRALSILRQRDHRPLFLWVHYFDAHAPYAPPPPYAGQGYAGEIAAMEDQILRLLEAVEALGRWEQTAIVLAGDHGEAFGEHGEQQHGFFIYDTTLHVPLIVKPAGPPHAARRCASPVCLTDIAPTMAHFAGLSLDPGPFARDLLEIARHNQPERPLFAQSLIPLLNDGAAPLASLRLGSFKLIDAPQPELYDLAHDPGEEHNLVAQDLRRVNAMLAQLHAMAPGAEEGAPILAATPLDPHAAEQLAALGYTAGDRTSSPSAGRVRSDPKQVLRATRQIEAGDRASARGDSAAAAAAYRGALDADPANWKATWKLADLEIERGDLASAEAVLRTAKERDPTNLAVDLRLAGVVFDRGRPAETLELCARVLARYPEHVKARTMRALALAALGKRAQARTQLQEILQEHPDDELARRSLAGMPPR